jgi:hypothetical protein
VLHHFHPIRDELTEQNGVIFKGERLVVPTSMRTEIIETLHCNHGDIQATVRRARDVFYWPGKSHEIENFVASGSLCSTYQSVIRKEPLTSHPIPTRPLQLLHW